MNKFLNFGRRKSAVPANVKHLASDTADASPRDLEVAIELTILAVELELSGEWLPTSLYVTFNPAAGPYKKLPPLPEATSNGSSQRSLSSNSLSRGSSSTDDVKFQAEMAGDRPHYPRRPGPAADFVCTTATPFVTAPSRGRSVATWDADNGKVTVVCEVRKLPPGVTGHSARWGYESCIWKVELFDVRGLIAVADAKIKRKKKK
jgi:hypothetical protein